MIHTDKNNHNVAYRTKYTITTS